MINYLLGLFTVPVLILAFIVCTKTAFAILKFADKYGYSVEWRGDRDPASVSDYTLKRDIWFEQAHPRLTIRSRHFNGPIYTGHWCRYDGFDKDLQPTNLVATRWFGIGKTKGRSLTFYKTRSLS